jgi:predicted short-subunit dehydrogenase-like oxidoreductase (DUF2520 family)
VKIAFVGCGAAGRPLGAAWRRAGHEIRGVHARTRAAEAVRVMGGGVADGPLDDADVVVFGVPDDALGTIARAHPLRADQVALHLSGAHPSTVLAPTGARTAGLHPLRAFADFDRALAALPRTWCFVEGDGADVAERLAKDLGASCARIATDRKVRYHAAAAMASNYCVTLLALAKDLFVDAGVAEEDALAALGGLAGGAIENVISLGLPRALTGPAARGDVAVVEAHLAALPPAVRDVYRALLHATLPLARARGSLSGADEARLRGLV